MTGVAQAQDLGVRVDLALGSNVGDDLSFRCVRVQDIDGVSGAEGAPAAQAVALKPVLDGPAQPGAFLGAVQADADLPSAGQTRQRLAVLVVYRLLEPVPQTLEGDVGRWLLERFVQPGNQRPAVVAHGDGAVQ